MAPAEKSAAVKTIATNRKALRDYFVLEHFEAGIELRGPEVKSIRDGRCSIGESYALVDGGDVLLLNFHVQPYEYSRAEGYNPVRPKRLLLHRREIDKVFGQASVKGQTLVPLRVYLKKGLVKIELALCKGKQAEDKREALRRKTADREAERAIASRTKRR
jgi:SsrA-binding protein